METCVKALVKWAVYSAYTHTYAEWLHHSMLGLSISSPSMSHHT